MCQTQLAHRLTRSKISHMQDFFDATNAFHSPSHSVLEAALKDVCTDDFIVALLLQRLSFATLQLACCDGWLYLRIRPGTLPGDAVACWWFLLVHNRAIESWSNVPLGMPLRASCRWLVDARVDDNNDSDVLQLCRDHVIPLACTTYADDVVRTRTIKTVASIANTSARALL